MPVLFELNLYKLSVLNAAGQEVFFSGVGISGEESNRRFGRSSRGGVGIAYS